MRINRPPKAIFMNIEWRKQAAPLLAGLLLLLPRALPAQTAISPKEAAEISYRSGLLVNELRDLLNVISNTETNKVETRDIIANSYSNSRNRIFYHAGILVENDLDPGAATPNEVTVERYLNDLDLLYQKSDTSSIDFRNIRVSAIKQADYLYVKVYFNSLFKNKYIATDAAYPVTNRLAEIRIDKDSSRWMLQITRLGFYKPEDTVNDIARNVVLYKAPPTPLLTAGLRAHTEAEEKYQSGYYKEALKVYTKAVRKDNRDAGLYLGRAKCYEQLGESDKALKDYTAVISLDNNNLQAIHRRARLYAAKNDYFKALTDYKLYTLINKTDTAAFSTMYDLHLATNNRKGALDDLDKIIAIDPKNGYAYYRKGLLLYGQKDNAGALSQFTTTIEIQPHFSGVYLQRGLVYADLQQIPQAIADFASVRQYGINNDGLKKIAAVGRTYYLRGLYHFNRSSWDSALAHFNTAILIDPGNAEYRYKRGEYCYTLKKYDSAIVYYTEAITLNKNYYEALYKRALCHFNQQRYEAAIPDFTLAVKASPQVAITYKKLGDAYFLLQQYAPAIASYDLSLQTAARISNKSLDIASLTDLYNNQGESYFNTGNYNKALECFSNAVKADKNTYKAWFNRGNTLLRMERFAEAEADLVKALAAQPANPLWNYTLGEVYKKVNNYSYAIQRYNRAIVMDKNGEVAAKARLELRNIKKTTGLKR
jgi:tetratricopeptide (TPR) repeat protein